MSLQRVHTRGRFYAAIRNVGRDDHVDYVVACARHLARACAGLLRDAKGLLVDDQRNAASISRAFLDELWQAKLATLQRAEQRAAAERRRDWRRDHAEIALALAANDGSDV